MKKRILIFPCGTESGLEIKRALENNLHFDIIGASSVTNNHGKYVFLDYFDELPFVEEENFVSIINKLINELNIDYVYPAHDSALIEMAKNSDQINCEVIAPDYQTCKICRSKKITYNYFKEKFKTPLMFEDLENISNFPVFIKPDIGQGAKGTSIVNSKEEAAFYLKNNRDLLLLEYLPGHEYTVDCFTNYKGELVFVGGRERARINNGISVNTFPVNNKRFFELAKIINESLKLRGAWFFQVKEDKDGELTLMEIEPRIAGTMGLFRNLGVNLPLLTLYDREYVEVEIDINNLNIQMDRALYNAYKIDLDFNKVFIDLDDTIIVNNGINTRVISFIYQCINEKIDVNLITKHRGDLYKTLREFRITELFNEIFWLKNEEKKYLYIDKNKSIFIDDSFAERIEVKKYLGIPTFGIDSIECLLDWRA